MLLFLTLIPPLRRGYEVRNVSKDIIKVRKALPLDGNVGGLSEFIIDPKHVTILDFLVLNP